MGTIVANEIIQSHPKLPYTNIVYMAAACQRIGGIQDRGHPGVS